MTFLYILVVGRILSDSEQGIGDVDFPICLTRTLISRNSDCCVRCYSSPVVGK